MSFKHKNHSEDLLFLPLGGSSEIGMNFNLYQYKGKWIIVDLGAGFPDDFLPGASVIIPDVSFLKKIKNDLLGIVLTHCHEDHFGAIQYLTEEINCKIYATKFSATLLKNKLIQNKVQHNLNICEIEPDGKLDLGPFSIDFMSLNHSIPEMQALFIKTDEGVVMHTGDWKFDHNPMIGHSNNEKALKKYGDEGILALVGDSTNIFNEENAGSEGDLRESMLKLVKSFDSGLVVIATFASNITRVETIAEIAKQTGKKLIVCGRSLWRLIDTAKESGYLKNAPEFYEADAIKNFSRNDVMILATGCQGEPMAAVNKIVNGQHRDVRFNSGDHVIFSSKIIPGNEKRIFRLFNQFIRMSVELYTERDHFVHVSGHPGRKDLKKMYGLVRPKILIPVHGEMSHMHEHLKFGLEECEIPHGIQVENGDVAKISSNFSEAKVINSVESGITVIDGKAKLLPRSNVMKMRRRIATEGVVVVTLLLDSNYFICCDPIINAPGILDLKENEEIMSKISDRIEKSVSDHVSSFAGKKSINVKRIEEIVRSAIRKILKTELGKNSPIEVNMISDS